jgi:hypothetical protein
MKKSSVKRIPLLLFLTVAFNCANAQINPVTTAIPFLRISPDARSGGMGDVGVATTPDVSSNFWNLAKIPFTKEDNAVGITYTPWLQDLGLNDVYLLCASAYHKVDDLNSIAGSIRYFSLGTIQFTDENGNNLQTFTPKEYAFDFGYTRKIGDHLGLGVSLRYVASMLANGSVGGTVYKTGTTVAGDFSIYKSPSGENGEGFGWGIALTNLGGKIGYTDDALDKDYIPANLGVGIAYTSVPNESSRITYALDINKLLVPSPPVVTGDSATDNAAETAYKTQSVVSSWFKSFSGGNQAQLLQASAGIEYTYADQFFVRGGYHYEDASQGGVKYFSVGLGLKYNVISVNLSYLVPSGNGITRDPLSNTIRFGLAFDLDKNASETSPAATEPN